VNPSQATTPQPQTSGPTNTKVSSADQLDKDIQQINHGDDPGRTFALRRLAKYETPVPERQAEVSRELWKSIEKDGQGYNEMRLLAIWGMPAELEKIHKYLGRGAMTKAVIYTLGKKKVPGSAKRIAPYLEGGKSGDGKALVQALIELGPESEEAVLPFIEPSRNEGDIKRALEVLGEVGTEKSIEPIKKVIAGKKKGAANAAKTALLKIEERVNKAPGN
jgi:hypothetical protein